MMTWVGLGEVMLAGELEPMLVGDNDATQCVSPRERTHWESKKPQ